MSSSPVERIQMDTSVECVELTSTPTLASSDLNGTTSGKSIWPLNNCSPFAKSHPTGLKQKIVLNHSIRSKLKEGNEFFAYRRNEKKLFQQNFFSTEYPTPALVRSKCPLLFQFHFRPLSTSCLRLEQLHRQSRAQRHQC